MMIGNRHFRVIGAALGGGMLLQSGGCDASGVTTEVLNSLLPTLLNILLSSLVGGIPI
jgi:hypothetical protein